MVEQMRYIRRCGHPNDMVIFGVTMDQKVKLYCLGCLMERIGLEPCEVLSLEEFASKYGGKKL